MDQGADLSLAVWTGAAWANNTGESTAATELGLQSVAYPNIGLAFEETGRRAVVTYAEAGVATPRYRTWTSGGGWSGTEASAATVDNGNGASSYIATQRLAREVGTNNLLLLTVNNYGNLMYQRWTSGSSAWDATATLLNSHVNGGTVDVPSRMSYGMDDDTLFYQGNNLDPRYKLWNTTRWDAANNASHDLGGVPYQVILRASPTRDETRRARGTTGTSPCSGAVPPGRL